MTSPCEDLRASPFGSPFARSGFDSPRPAPGHQLQAVPAMPRSREAQSPAPPAGDARPVPRVAPQGASDEGNRGLSYESPSSPLESPCRAEDMHVDGCGGGNPSCASCHALMRENRRLQEELYWMRAELSRQRQSYNGYAPNVQPGMGDR
eukprot:TRINITY_DN4707_c0_g1_i2.p3 TRINITY_DN4707_c0_g1~~TRINITY_DN4707_c0_g1_i2.p3  ORF type:complete len:150 (-),score=17.43 TRINITY_DN4707_c0_g1_i2:139-588(-)